MTMDSAALTFKESEIKHRSSDENEEIVTAGVTAERDA